LRYQYYNTIQLSFFMASKISPPQLSDQSTEGFDRFVTQLDRYIRLGKIDEGDRLDLLLLCVGERVASFYDDETWSPLTNEQKIAGETEYKRAVRFLRNKFSGDKNILSERLKLYSYKQDIDQSINDYLSSIRSIAKYCDFPSV